MANVIYHYIKVEGPIQSLLETMQRIFGGFVTTEKDHINMEHPILIINCESSQEERELQDRLSRWIYNNYRTHYDHWKVLGYMSGSRPYDEPEDITCFVHEPRRFNGRAIIQVTRLRKDWRQPRSKKQVLDMEFCIDEPGTWFDDEYNCHVDGCDHPCKTLEEAISKGIWVLRSRDIKTRVFPRYCFKKVSVPYEYSHLEPDYYHLDQAQDMTVDYMAYITAYEEENRLIEERLAKEAV